MNKVEESSGIENPEQSGIVSVNSRSRPKGNNNIIGKVIFVVAAVGVLGAMGLMFYNKMQAASATQIEAPKTAEDEAPNNINEPANIQAGRDFERDPLTPSAAMEPPGAVALSKQDQMIFTRRCAEGDEGAPLTAPDGREARDSKGQPIMVCADGRILVPAVQPINGETAKVKPIEMQQTAGGNSGGGSQTATQSGEVKRSRFAGAALLKTEDMPMASNGQSESNARRDQASNNLNAVTAMTDKLLATNSANRGGSPAFGALSMGNNGNGGGASPSQTEPIGSLLSSSATGKAKAAMLGNRSLMVAKGRSIDCGLSVRVINEVSGMTSCVVTRNIYSDDGRVLLIERGSEATGEYTAQMAQGQRRLFIIWNRIKTPKGVVINIDSPTTDSLGTSGIDGYVDNRWLDRLGAAFLLSIIQDAIAYKTATDAANGNAAAAAMENTSNTGNTMVEKILESTINIKPTIYKNQGDRIAISVARDLDFGDVYELDTQ